MNEANLVNLILRRIGSNTFLDAEQVEGGKRQFNMDGVQRLRISNETEALKRIDAAGIGHWTTFPTDNIQATVTRHQLRTIGFRGNY